MSFFNKKNDKPTGELRWSNREPMDERYKASFEWLRKILLKKPEEQTDWEKEVQKIYKNIIIF